LSLKYNVSITTSQANAIINAMVLVAVKPTFHCEKTCHIIKTYQRIKTLVMSTTIAKSIKVVIGVTMQHVKQIRHLLNILVLFVHV
jgi:pyrroline-5-carboxylate reductase